MVKYSDVIAIGEIIAKSDLLEIEPVNGGDTRLFTDYAIQLQEVFKDGVNKKNETVHDPSLTKSKEEADPYYGLKQNLKTGFISQEEYDEAIKQLNQYAKIVNKK